MSSKVNFIYIQIYISRNSFLFVWSSIQKTPKRFFYIFYWQVELGYSLADYLMILQFKKQKKEKVVDFREIYLYKENFLFL